MTDIHQKGSSVCCVLCVCVSVSEAIGDYSCTVAMEGG